MRRAMSVVCAAKSSFREIRRTNERPGARKLKCSGETTGCVRCIRDKVTCNYSAQKPMGRPRKRRRAEDDDGDGDASKQQEEVQTISNNENNLIAQWDQGWNNLLNERTNPFTDEFEWLNESVRHDAAAVQKFINAYQAPRRTLGDRKPTETSGPVDREPSQRRYCGTGTCSGPISGSHKPIQPP
jgi:hypothetical protein